ncbi:hypothetical protein [Streptomyces sp. NPDC060198]|uniref:hypothetical protein n=1 Tax=Streptomyces sp. NPDC060198 TaxID=3347070 RepID=UPI00364ECC3B
MYVAYDDGEMVGLGVEDGGVRLRERLTVKRVGVVGTALTVAGPGRLLIGTGDGRVLVCAVGEAVSGGPEER